MRPVVLALLVALALVAGCTRVETPPTTTTAPAVTTPPVTTTPSPAEPLGFDGARAFEHVRDQVLYPNGSVRHRVPGTPGNDEAARIISDALIAEGFTVAWHHFNATYGCGRTVPMHNVVAERAGTSGKVVLLGAHYDTRPVADKDPDQDARDEPIPGANDAGSGVGVLLELARVAGPTDDALRLVFFDGEDGGDIDACTDWILGSTAYAGNLTESEARAVKAMVLVDMVGDPDLVLPREALSTKPLQDRIYAIGGSLGYADVFVNDTSRSYAITDDHKPFLDRGIPAVDLIHLVPAPKFFPSWHHTHADGLESVSPGSLAIVGRTLEAWLEQGAPAS